MQMLLDKVEVLGTCVHCLVAVTVAKVPSLEAFLAFERTKLCPDCQALR